MNTNWNTQSLRNAPTIAQGQCCDLKVETSQVRVWLCRASDAVTVEQYNPRTARWGMVSNGHKES